MTDLLEIASRCENAISSDRGLDIAIAQATDANGYRIEDDGTILVSGDMGDGPGWFNIGYDVPAYTASIDAAMTLLPPRACNIDLFSFGGGGRDDLPEDATCWGFKFHDQDQLVGAERAKAEVSRLRKDIGGLFKIAGAPKMVLERAIAENFMEFSSSHTANAALAICAAAVRARPNDPVGGR